MSFAPASEVDTGNVAGSFTEVSCGKYFEFSQPQDDAPWPEFPVKVWVADGTMFRWAKVAKTRVWMVVDEGECGEPVCVKWVTRNRRDFS